MIENLAGASGNFSLFTVNTKRICEKSPDAKRRKGLGRKGLVEKRFGGE